MTKEQSMDANRPAPEGHLSRIITRVLEEHSSCCLDDPADRAGLQEALTLALADRECQLADREAGLRQVLAVRYRATRSLTSQLLAIWTKAEALIHAWDTRAKAPVITTRHEDAVKDAEAGLRAIMDELHG